MSIIQINYGVMLCIWGNFYMSRMIRLKGLQRFLKINIHIFQKEKDESMCNDMAKVMQFMAEVILVYESSDAQFYNLSMIQDFINDSQQNVLGGTFIQCIFGSIDLIVFLDSYLVNVNSFIERRLWELVLPWQLLCFHIDYLTFLT